MQSIEGNEGSPVQRRLVGPQWWTEATVAGAWIASKKTSGKVYGWYSLILLLAVWLMIWVEVEVGVATTNQHAFMFVVDKLGLKPYHSSVGGLWNAYVLVIPLSQREWTCMKERTKVKVSSWWGEWVTSFLWLRVAKLNTRSPHRAYLDSSSLPPSPASQRQMSLSNTQLPGAEDIEGRQGQAQRFTMRFRVLIIGRANAGKTTILQRVCNTTEQPKIFNQEGHQVFHVLDIII